MGYKKMEQIHPQIFTGRIERRPDRIDYSKDDGTVVSFPLDCLFYLEQLCEGRSIQGIIINNYKINMATDFIALKKTLVTLYWSNSIKNSQDFREELENSDWVPTDESHLLKTFEEFDLAKKSFLFKIVALAISLGPLFFAFRLYTAEKTSIITLLFIPMCFLSLKGLASVILSSFLSRRPQNLALHFSILGVYARESSIDRRPIGPVEYLFHLAASIGLCILGLIALKQNENSDLISFGLLLAALLVSILNSPGYKSDLSNLLLSVEKRRTFFGSLTYTFGATLYFLSAGTFFFLFIAKMISGIRNWDEVNHAPYFVLGVFALIFFLDILDTLDFIVGHFSKSVGLPLKTIVSNLFNLNSKGRLIEIFKKIPIFNTLPKEIIEEMHRCSRIVELGQATVICKSGQISTDLYVVLKGNVGIYNSDSLGKFSKVMELKSGAIFGEGGFFLNKPRSGEAITLTKATILCVKRPAQLENTIRKGALIDSTFQKKVWAYQALTASRLFKDVPSELIMHMVDKGSIVELPKNQTLIKELDFPDSMYVLVEGECVASNETHSGSKITSGNVIGEIGVLWNSRRTRTVVTKTPIIALRIDAIEIWKILSLSLTLAATLQGLGQERLLSDAA